MDKIYLCVYNSNWADEMDICGFRVMTEQKWLEFQEKFNNYKRRYNFCIGTNEDIEYRNGSAVLKEISATEITPEHAEFLNKKLGKRFGFFPRADYLD